MPTTNDVLWFRSPANICVPKGEPKRPSPHKLLENIVILYFESRFHKQNSVIRPKIKHFAPPQIFRLATPLPAKWTGKAGHETKICEHWQGPLKRARVNNFNPLSGWWHKYAKQARSHSTTQIVIENSGSDRVPESPLIYIWTTIVFCI